MQNFTHPFVITGTIVVTGDWLHALRDTDDHGEKHHINLGDDAGTGQRNFTSVRGKCTLMTQGIIHDDLYDHHGNLINKR